MASSLTYSTSWITSMLAAPAVQHGRYTGGAVLYSSAVLDVGCVVRKAAAKGRQAQADWQPCGMHPCAAAAILQPAGSGGASPPVLHCTAPVRTMYRLRHTLVPLHRHAPALPTLTSTGSMRALSANTLILAGMVALCRWGGVGGGGRGGRFFGSGKTSSANMLVRFQSGSMERRGGGVRGQTPGPWRAWWPWWRCACVCVGGVGGQGRGDMLMGARGGEGKGCKGSSKHAHMCGEAGTDRKSVV